MKHGLIKVLGNKYIAHHFSPIEFTLPYRVAYSENYDPWPIVEEKPNLVICFDEHWCELGNAVGVLKDAGIPTLQVMDGILEWRRTWDYTRDGIPVDGTVNPINQPAIADVVACLGTRDNLILNSWGNQGKCEVIGVPRFDNLVSNYHSLRKIQKEPTRNPFRLLIMTAKSPGFTEEQIQTTVKSLNDLRNHLEERFHQIEVVWRLTKNLEQKIGVKSKISDLTGKDLHTILRNVDAVVTTPSTALLESMLFNIPVATLDYHNCPHYFETAWNIYAEDHIDRIIENLMNPEDARMGYQQYLLREQLQIVDPAANRLINLIKHMVEGKDTFDSSGYRVPLYAIRHNGDSIIGDNYAPYYPGLAAIDQLSDKEVRIQLAAALGTNKVLYSKNQHLKNNLNQIPGYKLLKGLRKKIRELK